MKNKGSFERRNATAGRLFCLPFYIGFIFFFARPLFQTLIFAFSDISIEIGSLQTTFTGLKNIRFAFFEDSNFTDNLIRGLSSLLYQIPVIIISSLFFALLLNKEFAGRTLARAIFFIPVIVASGVIINVLKIDIVAGSMMAGNISNVTRTGSFNNYALQDLLINSGLDQRMVNYFTNISNNLFDLLWQTGIQMILFLAGLQTISPSLYESSAIEGATAWEDFWMITFPMLTPIILLNIIYSIVASFTDFENPSMRQILTQFNNLRFGQAAAMAWVYFLLIAIILLAIILLFSRLEKDADPKKKERWD